jgi:hypothetical protein
MKGQHVLLVASTSISLLLLPSADVTMMVTAAGISSWRENNHGVPPSLRGSNRALLRVSWNEHVGFGNSSTNTTEIDHDAEEPEDVVIMPPQEPQQQQQNATQPPAPCTTPADFCLMDMKECPDGSLVARDPQLCCAFRPCPGEDGDDVNDDTSSTPLLDWLDQVFDGPGR